MNCHSCDTLWYRLVELMGQLALCFYSLQDQRRQHNPWCYVRVEVLLAVSIMITISWNLTPRTLIGRTLRSNLQPLTSGLKIKQLNGNRI
jgi:hypothetical protein